MQLCSVLSWFKSGSGAARRDWQLESAPGLGLRTRIRKEIFPGSQLRKLVPTICSLGEKCQTSRGLLWLLLEGMKEGNDT